MGRLECTTSVSNWPNNMLAKYNNVLTHNPGSVMLVVLFLSISCTIYTVRVGSLPDFSEPTLGFTASGTDIANRIEAWNHLADLNSTYIQDPSNALQNGSIEYLKYGTHNMVHARSGKGRLFLQEKNAHAFKREDWEDDEADDADDVEMEQADQPVVSKGDPETLSVEEDYGHVVFGIEDMSSGLNDTLTSNDVWQKLRMNHVPFGDYFCPLSRSTKNQVDNVRMVMKRMDNHKHAEETLFELNALRAMCDLQTKIESVPSFHSLCVKDSSTPQCCRTWSLPNFVVLINRLQHCYDVQETHVQQAQMLMKRCLPYYRDGQLLADCQLNECDAPPQCTANNVVYQMMHFLSNNDSLTSNTWRVSSAMILLPLVRTASLLKLYNELHDIDLKNKYVEVVAMDFGDLKDDLFDLLVYPSGVYIVYVLAGTCTILMLIWINTRSFLDTVCLVLTIFIVWTLSVFIYSYVIPRTVFPFMNLLAIIAYSIYGTIDVVVFLRVWNLALKSQSLPKTLHKMAATTMRTAISGFITTSIIGSVLCVMTWSSIRDIRLFGYFAVITLICHYIIMLTWVPASIWTVQQFTCCSGSFASGLRKTLSEYCKQCDQFTNRMISRYLKTSTCIAGIIICAIPAVTASALHLFVLPGISFSESPKYQLFTDNHPIERYAKQYRNQFAYETVDDKDNARGTMPLYFVWGLIPDGQRILVDKTMDAYATESQSWLRSFCQAVQEQPFSKRKLVGGPRTADCFIETVATSMRRECVNQVRNYDRSPCCNVPEFPIDPALFKTCLPRIIGSLYRTPASYFRRSSAGPLFEKFKFNHSHFGKNAKRPVPEMRAFVLRFESTVDYTSPYEVVRKMENDVSVWFDQQLSNAPTSLRHGWFVSDLMLFDVQQNIAKNLLTGLGVALIVATFIILGTTKQIGVTVYVIFTAAISGWTIICILVWILDWQLYVLECICLYVGIALITQCSLLYAVAYCDSIPECFAISTRERVRFACNNMFGPALFAACVTAVLAGLLAQSPIHPISRLGTVMALTVAVTVFYGTCFFISTLYLFEPKIDSPIGCLWSGRQRTLQVNDMDLESPENQGAKEQLHAVVLNVDAESGRGAGGHKIEMKLTGQSEEHVCVQRSARGSVHQNPLYKSDMEETSFGAESTVHTQQVDNVIDALVEVHRSPTISEAESSMSLSAAGHQPLLPSNPNAIEAEHSSEGAPDTQSSSLAEVKGIATNKSVETHLGSPLSTGAISDLPSDEIGQNTQAIADDDDTADDIKSTSTN